METLVLIPTKPNIDKRIFHRSIKLERELYGFTVIRDFTGSGDSELKETLIQKATRIAVIRQEMVEKYVRDQDYVLWIDADIIDYSRKTIDHLIKVSQEYGAITAPMILIEGSMQFWDIAGFIQNSKWISRKHPFFEINEDYVDMQSVGCFYLVPGDVYKTRKYVPVINPLWTEHYNICKDNRTICCTNLNVIHSKN